MVFLFINTITAQDSDIAFRGGLGYDSGLSINLGIGFASGLENSLGEGVVFTTSLGFEFLTIEKNKYYGPDFNVFLAPFPNLLGLGFGVNTSYLKNDDNNIWKFNIRPEIGFTAAGLITIKYGYNLTNINEFYPANYSKSSITLVLNLPSSIFN